MSNLISTAQARQLLGISRNLLESMDLPRYRLGKRKVFYQRADVLAAVVRCRVKVQGRFENPCVNAWF